MPFEGNLDKPTPSETSAQRRARQYGAMIDAIGGSKSVKEVKSEVAPESNETHEEVAEDLSDESELHASIETADGRQMIVVEAENNVVNQVYNYNPDTDTVSYNYKPDTFADAQAYKSLADLQQTMVGIEAKIDQGEVVDDRDIEIVQDKYDATTGLEGADDSKFNSVEPVAETQPRIAKDAEVFSQTELKQVTSQLESIDTKRVALLGKILKAKQNPAGFPEEMSFYESKLVEVGAQIQRELDNIEDRPAGPATSNSVGSTYAQLQSFVSEMDASIQRMENAPAFASVYKTPDLPEDPWATKSEVEIDPLSESQMESDDDGLVVLEEPQLEVGNQTVTPNDLPILPRRSVFVPSSVASADTDKQPETDKGRSALRPLRLFRNPRTANEPQPEESKSTTDPNSLEWLQRLHGKELGQDIYMSKKNLRRLRNETSTQTAYVSTENTTNPEASSSARTDVGTTNLNETIDIKSELAKYGQDSIEPLMSNEVLVEDQPIREVSKLVATQPSESVIETDIKPRSEYEAINSAWDDELQEDEQINMEAQPVTSEVSAIEIDQKLVNAEVGKIERKGVRVSDSWFGNYQSPYTVLGKVKFQEMLHWAELDVEELQSYLDKHRIKLDVFNQWLQILPEIEHFVPDMEGKTFKQVVDEFVMNRESS